MKDLPIVCTLDAAHLPDRLAQWRDLAQKATSAERSDDGIRMRFDRSVDVAAIAALAHAEQQCCSFFTFTLTIDAVRVTLDIAAPHDARALVDALVR